MKHQPSPHRSLGLAAIAAAVLSGVLVTMSASPAAAASPVVNVVSSLATVQPLDTPAGSASASLTALRGEAESFQIVVRGEGGGALGNVDTVLQTALATAGGSQLPATATTLSLEAYTRIWTPSDQEATDPDPSLPARQRGWCQHFQSFAMPDPSTCGIPTSYSTDGTPFNNQWKCGGATAPVVDVRRCLFPDALIPRVDPYFGQTRNAFPFNVPAGENRVVWVDVLVPPDATAGTYNGTVRVTATGMTAVDVPISLVVKPTRLPASGEDPALDLAGGVRAGTDVGPSFCDVQGCGATIDTRYRQQSLFVRSALENRLPLTNLPARDAPYAGAHRTAFNKWIAPYVTGAGPTTTVDGVLPARLSAARSRTVLLDHFIDSEGWKVWTEALAATGNQGALRFYCDEVLQSAALFADQCSNPYDDAAVPGWTQGGGTGTLRSFLIGSQALYDTAHARGRLVTTRADTLVPNTMFHLHRRGAPNTRPSYDTGFLAGGAGRRVWGFDSNNALGAGTDWTTSNAYNGYPAIGGVDQPATSERAAGFVAWSYRLAGHFYYSSMHRFGHAWNDCSTTPASCLYDSFGGHGDGTLYYPGPTARVGGTDPIPLESMRLKRFRDGSEDYSVLRLLETGCAGYGGCTAKTRNELLAIVGGPELAENVGAMSRPYNTSIGAGAYDQVRADLMALLPDPAPVEPPVTDTTGRIAFSSNRDGDYEIFTMDPDGGEVVQLTSDAAADKFPAWSPDGRRIAWTRGSDIWVMDADGSDAVNLSADTAAAVSKPAWSADGSSIVYVYATGGLTDIYKMAADGSGKTPLVTYASGGISSYDPSVSPTGVVYFSQDAGGGAVPGIFRIDLAGGGYARVTSGIDEVVDVSPDGQQLTFSRSADGAAPYDIYRSDIAGGALLNVTATAGGGPAVNDLQSAFSPGGGSVVYASAVGGDFEIWVGDSGGVAAEAITTNTAADLDPDWSATASRAAVADFDGDGDTDRSVFRNGAWYREGAGSPDFLGVPGDVPVPADYDGDGTTERAVYRTGAWYIEGQAQPIYHGIAGDIPVPGDFDGDGDDEPAVYRPSSGGWYPLGQSATFYGLNGDVPVPGDFDGDGDDDAAVWRPAVGAWYRSSTGAPLYLGLSTDVPVPADYDGDGDDDAAVWRPAVGAWYLEGQAVTYHGLNGDVPVPGDFDGDGDADRAVWRKATGGWFVVGAATVHLGLSSDIPLPLPAAARARVP